MSNLLERAMERLMEDEGLLEDLVDPEAQQLLLWGQAQVAQLVTEAQSQDAEDPWAVLQPRLKDLRKQIRWMARISAESENPGEVLNSLLNESAQAASPEAEIEMEIVPGPQPGAPEVPADPYAVPPEPPQEPTEPAAPPEVMPEDVPQEAPEMDPGSVPPEAPEGNPG